MATATATMTITSTDATLKNEVVFGTITFSAVGDTYATHGLVLNGLSGNDLIKSGSNPNIFEIMPVPAAGTSPTGYTYVFCQGTTFANCLVAIMNGTTEFSNGAAITAPFGETLVFRASFPRL